MEYELVNWVYRPTHIMQHLVQVRMEQYSTPYRNTTAMATDFGPS